MRSPTNSAARLSRRGVRCLISKKGCASGGGVGPYRRRTRGREAYEGGERDMGTMNLIYALVVIILVLVAILLLARLL